MFRACLCLSRGSERCFSFAFSSSFFPGRHPLFRRRLANLCSRRPILPRFVVPTLHCRLVSLCPTAHDAAFRLHLHLPSASASSGLSPRSSGSSPAAHCSTTPILASGQNSLSGCCTRRSRGLLPVYGSLFASAGCFRTTVPLGATSSHSCGF